MSEALLARRKLGNELLRLREEAGLTQAEVGKILWLSGSTVHRMEQGRSQIKGPQIESLLRALKVDDEKLQDRLLHLATVGQEGGYRESLSTDALQFFGYEEVASQVKTLELVVVPGLLQTDDYAREVVRSVQGITDGVDDFLESRRDRQRKIIYRERPPRLAFLIDEAVLNRPFGSTAAMKEQLRRLQEFQHHPNISIKIVPLAAGASPALRGSFTILEFDEYPDVLFIEGPRGDQNVYEAEAIAARREVWTTIDTQYVPEDNLDHYIQRAIDNL